MGENTTTILELKENMCNSDALVRFYTFHGKKSSQLCALGLLSFCLHSRASTRFFCLVLARWGVFGAAAGQTLKEEGGVDCKVNLFCEAWKINVKNIDDLNGCTALRGHSNSNTCAKAGERWDQSRKVKPCLHQMRLHMYQK